MYIDICLLQMFGGKTDRLVTFTVNCLLQVIMPVVFAKYQFNFFELKPGWKPKIHGADMLR